jgi:hypothetical protein
MKAIIASLTSTDENVGPHRRVPLMPGLPDVRNHWADKSNLQPYADLI